MIKTNRTANLYYQIHRTLIVKEFYKRLPDFDVRELYLGSLEIMFTGFVTLHGKWTRGDYPFWFRYGSSIAVPSTVPSFLSVDEATEMVEWFDRAFIDISLRLNSVKEKTRLTKDLHETLLGSYGEFASLPKRIRNKKNIDRDFNWLISAVRNQSKLLTKKFMLTYLPEAFEKKFPDEAMRIKTYATRYAGGSEEVMADLAKFEDLWSRYPYGLSNSQYQQELARM